MRLEALFEDHGKWVIAMELIEGRDLLEALYVEQDGLCFDESRLRETFLQLASGLEALHPEAHFEGQEPNVPAFP